MPDRVGQSKILGVLAQFEDPGALMKAAEIVRDAGYKKYDCHSPFPIHGMNEAMGMRRSKIGYIAGIMAFIGGSAALALQGWTSTYAYPLVISGKPFFSYQAYFPITFAMAVLFAALGTIFGFLVLMKLRYHHPLFYSNRFSRFSDDGFFISIEAGDPLFDVDKAKEILESAGGTEFELLEER